MPEKLLPSPQTQIPDVKSSFTIIDGAEEDFAISRWSGNYIVILFLTGSNHPVSEENFKLFSEATPDFEALKCKTLAVTLDSTLTLFEWIDKSDQLTHTVTKLMPVLSDRDAVVSR